MKNYHAFLIFLSANFLLVMQPEISHAQSECSGRMFGIPICTGFCVNLDTSSVHKRINKLEQSADSLLKEAAKLSDSLLRQPMPTFGNFGDEFYKQWQLNVPHDLHYPFDGSLHLPPIPVIPHLEFLNPPFFNATPLPPIYIDPILPEDFFEPGVPHSPFYYIPPDNMERMPNDIHGRMPSPKIEPFKKEEKKNPIPDFKGWYLEKLADVGK